MADYDIKKGCFKNIEGDQLKDIMRGVFGNVSVEGDLLVSSYGVLSRIEVKIINKETLSITTVGKEGALDDAEILDSKRRLNIFAFNATGFDAKARMKRAQAKAKKGEL